MTERIEYGTKAAADAAREEHAALVRDEKDDRRTKTVEFVDDAPDDVLEQIRLMADESRDEGGAGAGQIPLTDSERDQIDFSKGRASIPHARSVKGIARSFGVDDWLSFYDAELTVDEHREVMEQARQDDGGQRRDADRLEERRRDAARTAQDQGCDHAAGHCENGDPEACEYLAEVCGYDEDEIASIMTERPDDDPPEQRDLVTVGGEGTPFVAMDVTAQEAGALRDSWTGYKAGIGELDDALDTVREAVTDARQAIATVNRIRRENGEEELHPNRLHELLDSLRNMPESIPETRTLDHFGATPTSDVDDVTPMSEVTDEQLAQRAPSRPDPATLRPDVLDDRDDDVPEESDDDQDADQFAAEKQGSLDVGVEQQEKKDEGQATLTGDPATPENAVLPPDWTRKGTTWTAGPYKITLDSPDGDVWAVRLFGDGDSLEIASGLREAAQADDIAVEFTERIDPDDVSFHNGDEETQTAIAEAKKAVLEGSDSGLGRFATA